MRIISLAALHPLYQIIYYRLTFLVTSVILFQITIYIRLNDLGSFVRSKKFASGSNGLITRFVKTSNRSNDLDTRLVKTFIRSNDLVTRLVKTLIRSNGLITRLVKTSNHSNDLVTHSVKPYNHSNDLVTHSLSTSVCLDNLRNPTNMEDFFSCSFLV